MLCLPFIDLSCFKTNKRVFALICSLLIKKKSLNSLFIAYAICGTEVELYERGEPI